LQLHALYDLPTECKPSTISEWADTTRAALRAAAAVVTLIPTVMLSIKMKSISNAVPP
jgi:hypothetical protein